MKKTRYKDQNKKSYNKILIVLFVLIFILFCLVLALNSAKKDVTETIDYKDISSIKDVIEYHKSKYISEKNSSEVGFYLDVYVDFKVPLYNGYDSNEDYFNVLIEDCAKVMNYYSFRLFDEKKDIKIYVVCDKVKVKKIIINEMEDYFIYNDSQNSLKRYQEIPNTEFSITSSLLNTCISNNWSKDTYFGERDSIFKSYNIYFDEGIKVRIIDGSIYNIIFTDKYLENVIEDITTATKKDYIVTRLGKPTFEDEETGIFGYKNEQIYIFFSNNEISVYRNSNINSDDFFDLSDKYSSGDLDLLEFMNELTYMWPDYSEYIYGQDMVYIKYPLKGIEIRINYGDINGILVYNNNKSTLSKIGRYLEKTIFVSRLQIDLVFEAEKDRLNKEIELNLKCDEYEKSLDDASKKRIGSSLRYKMYPNKDEQGYISRIYFISKFNTEPCRELIDGVSSFLWINDDYFLFSKAGIGVYFYNLNTGRVQRIPELTGKENFDLLEYKDGILTYDNTQIRLQF